jgi:4-oxalocrotonate tautomerase
MPFVRIDVPGSASPSQRRAIADVVYGAMRETLNVPEKDRFQVIAGHAAGDMIIDPTYLDIARSAAAIIIQVTLNEGRTLEMKKAFYKSVADGLHKTAGMRREDVFINLVEVKKENWSFGNGIAQYG